MTTQYAIAPAGVASLTGCVAKLGKGGIGPDLHTSSGVTADADFPTQYLCTFSPALVAMGNYDLYLYNSGGLLLSKSDVTFLGTDGETATERAAVLDSATQAQIDTIIDGIGWTLASLYGACANPQTTDPLVQLTINGYTYSGQYSGMNSAGVRTAPTLSKV